VSSATAGSGRHRDSSTEPASHSPPPPRPSASPEPTDAKPSTAARAAQQPAPATLPPLPLLSGGAGRPTFGWRLQASAEQAKASAALSASQPLLGKGLSLGLPALGPGGWSITAATTAAAITRRSPSPQLMPLPLPSVRSTPSPRAQERSVSVSPPHQQQQEAAQPGGGDRMAAPVPRRQHPPPMHLPAPAADREGDPEWAPAARDLSQAPRRGAQRRIINLNDAHALLAIAQSEAAALEQGNKACSALLIVHCHNI